MPAALPDPGSVRHPQPSLSLNPNAPVLPQLLDSVVLAACEAQKAFADRYLSLGEWGADLSEQRFWMEGGGVRAEFVPFFVGSTAGGSDSWMWGWNNINEFPQPVVAIAQDVLAFGEHVQEPLLTVAQLPLSPAARAEQGLPQPPSDLDLQQVLVWAAAALSGIAAPVWYRGDTGPGSYAWFLLANPAEFSLPPATVLPTISAITTALGMGAIGYGARALEAYAARRDGVTLHADPNSEGLLLRTTDGDVVVEVDELGRIVRVQATAGAVPSAAPAPTAPSPERAKGWLGKLFGR